jgi:sister-chromatid-cohesion protein PDS5
LQAIAEEYASADSADIECVAARAAALAQLSRFAPEAFDKHSNVYMTFLVKKLLMTPQPPGSEDMDDGEEWFENDNVPELLRAKVQALKVCRYRCLAHADKGNALDLAAPVMKLYATLLEHNGSLPPQGKEGEQEGEGEREEDPKFASRLRLQAAVSVLKLVTVQKFAEALQKKFLRVAVTIQVGSFGLGWKCMLM